MRIWAAVFALILVAPAAAGATSVEVKTKGTPSPAALVGPDVFYSAYPAAGQQIRAVGPSGDRLIRQFTAAPANVNEDDGDSDVVTYEKTIVFNASTGALATRTEFVQRTKGAEVQRSVSVDFGPLAGPYKSYSECGGGLPSSLDGNRLALGRCPPGGVRRTELLDVAADTVIATYDGASPVDLAGDRIALYEGDSVVVRDVNGGAEIYRVLSEPLSSWELQADGKLLQRPLYDDAGKPVPFDGCHTQLWHSPSDPAGHALPGCGTYKSPQFAADRAVYEVRVPPSSEPILVTSDLSGQSRTLARGVPAFDWDGTRALYTCDNGKLYLDDLQDEFDSSLCADASAEEDEDVRGCHPSDPTARQVGSRRCRVDIRGRTAAVDSKGRVTLRVVCSVGCRGDIRVRRRVGGEWKWVSAKARLSIAADRTKRVRLRLNGAGPGAKVQVVSHSLNRVSGKRAYFKTVRLVRG